MAEPGPDVRRLVFEEWLREIAAKAATPQERAEAIGSVVGLVAATMLSTNDERADFAIGFAVGAAAGANRTLDSFTRDVHRYWPAAVSSVETCRQQVAAQIVAGALEEMRRG